MNVIKMNLCKKIDLEEICANVFLKVSKLLTSSNMDKNGYFQIKADISKFEKLNYVFFSRKKGFTLRGIFIHLCTHNMEGYTLHFRQNFHGEYTRDA